MTRLTDWLLTKPRPTQGDVFAALDIGSSKIACFIARTDREGGAPRVIGIGHQVAAGMRNGAVANMEALQNAISATVATAEQMAGEMIDRVIVNVAGAQVVSHTVNIELPLNGREVVESDLQRIAMQAQSMMPDDQARSLELLHTIPVHYALDHQQGIRDPIGMTGNLLHSQLHLVSAEFGPVRTLVTAIARCHLDVERLVASPYASGISCLVEDEMDLGSLVIDMGAGTTNLAVFFDGNAVYCDGIAVGGAHVTNDIARGLTTPVVHAERLKTLYGNAILSPMDEREIIDVPQVGEEDAPENANHIPKAHLVRIIQPRLEEIFEMVRARISRSGFQDVAGRRVVLTGGASQLPGTRELAQRILDKQVRLGRPLRVARPFPSNSKMKGSAFTGLAEATSGAAFSTTAGLLAIAMQPELAPSSNPFSDMISGGSLFTRMGQWVRQNM